MLAFVVFNVAVSRANGEKNQCYGLVIDFVIMAGAVGGRRGALKMDTLIYLHFGFKSANHSLAAVLLHERLFHRKTGGSSFPNGNFCVTHAAAVFTL